ncbi:uncharacterized protein M437DRAFT_89428 [Aureobasidium melanogenum CBS 110374]|uniref:Uncharacterized protein n=1 Tax=Aureobasidium melanogenum (strain CBS 110374) TaxID=1043003 RepID=A0A074V9Z7_AURM1|nr:uncharacterized protein M437DRAFT_89428 [Aureobasidium melanogenum CBS 110374]KEQ57460.1 hypothetical protein M437DRAFT_89428 [Aureobasidium melanogenum CBS 110374]
MQTFDWTIRESLQAVFHPPLSRFRRPLIEIRLTFNIVSENFPVPLRRQP